MKMYLELLSGGDLRSTGISGRLVGRIRNQKDFDDLFWYLFHPDRVIVMRAADCIEKISSKTPKYLSKHKNEIFALCQEVRNKELQWHLAQMLSRLNLEDHEYAIAWKWLRDWALDASNSRIVRVNSLQALFDLSVRKDDKRRELNRLIAHLELENIPSLNARIRRIKRQILHAPS